MKLMREIGCVSRAGAGAASEADRTHLRARAFDPARHVRGGGGRLQPDRRAARRGGGEDAGDPVSRVALLLGRALRDILTLLLRPVIVILVSLPFGLRVNLAGLLVVLALVTLIGLVMASASYALALTLRSEDSFAPLLFAATLPLLLLSGVLPPPTLAPAWLRDVAAANPLSYAVDAARAIFNDRTSPGPPVAAGRDVAV